jgi:AP-4 complex subunit epsilon-1
MLKVSLSLNPKDTDLFEHMIRLLYIETLGHDGSFAHIYPVNLCQSKVPKLKRMGYLLTTLCLNRNSKLSILMLSTIQKDLTSTNLHYIMYCLTALPKLINKTIIEGSL